MSKVEVYFIASSIATTHIEFITVNRNVEVIARFSNKVKTLGSYFYTQLLFLNF